MPFLGWEKGGGVPAKLDVRIEQTARGTKFQDVLLSGEGFQAAGEFSVDKSGKLASLTMKDVKFKPGDNFDINLDALRNGYEISVSGASFDVRGLIAQFLSGPGDAGLAGMDYSISLKLGQIHGYNGVSISGISGSLAASDGKITKLLLKGGTGAAPIELAFSSAGQQQSLELRSSNGGALLRFLNIYDKAFGGDLGLRFAGARDSGDGSGALVFENFRIQNEQVLSDAARERVRRGDADQEIRSTDVVVDTTNLSFAKLRVPFRKHKGVITVADASLRGPVVGASGRGTIDLEGQNLALSGTIVPAYGINNLPGSIPILGQLLGGRKREGLIGITYQMFGPMRSPTLKMNPASAIAPGIFRRIFEYN